MIAKATIMTAQPAVYSTPIIRLIISRLLLLTACFLGLSNGALAETETAIDQIDKQLGNHVNQINKNGHYSKVEYEATLPDERLNLEPCSAPLSIENRSPSRILGRLTFKVACDNATKPWAVNISVNLTAYDHIVVASRPIPKGSKITRNMLIKKEQDVTRLRRGYFKDFKHVVGAISRFSLGGNRPLKPGNILPPTLVTKGEKVIISASSTGLSIRASGIALSDGALGEVVKVKNVRTTRIIEGRVSGAGQITVSL